MSKYTFLVFLLSALFLNSSFKIKKGCSGTYFIAGKVFDKKDKLIENESIHIFYGDKKLDKITSKNGEFEIEIEWINACKSGSSYLEHERTNNRLNPEKIFITCNNVTISIPNEWKKYGKCGVKNKEEITNKKDLHFN